MPNDSMYFLEDTLVSRFKTKLLQFQTASILLRLRESKFVGMKSCPKMFKQPLTRNLAASFPSSVDPQLQPPYSTLSCFKILKCSMFCNADLNPAQNHSPICMLPGGGVILGGGTKLEGIKILSYWGVIQDF